MDQVRDAIGASDLSLYAIAKAAEIYLSTLTRFMSGERGLSIDALEKLAPVLRLEIIVTEKKKTKK